MDGFKGRFVEAHTPDADTARGVSRKMIGRSVFCR